MADRGSQYRLLTLNENEMEIRTDLLGSLQDHESSVVRSVLSEVGDTLDAVEELPVGALVDVGPRLEDALGSGCLGEGDREVDGVERDEELVGAPDVSERLDHARLLANVPGELLLADSEAEDGRTKSNG